MKILHFLSGFWISYNAGNTNYIRSLSRYQRGLGHSVSVMCKGWEGLGSENFFDEVIEFESLSVVSSLSFMRDSVEKTRLLLDKISGYDVVHFHGLYGVPISFFASKMPVKYVISLHDYDLICPRIFMVDKRGEVCLRRNIEKCSQCVGVLEQFDLLYRATRKLGINMPTIASSNVYERKKILDNFLLNARVCHAVSSRVKVIFDDAVSGLSCWKENLALDDLYFDRCYSEPRLEGGDKINIVYMGTLNYIKGAEVLMKLLDGALNKERFNIEVWGRCDQFYAEALKNKGVVLRGAYSQEQVGEILKNADIGLILSVWNETGPLVAQEMLLNKIPLLGTNMGGVPDFVNERVGKIFDPHSEEGVNEAIGWLNSLNRDKINKMKKSIPPMKRMRDHISFVERMYRA